MKPPSLPSDRAHCSSKDNRCSNLPGLTPFVLCSLVVTTVFSFFILHSSTPFRETSKQSLNRKNFTMKTPKDGREGCDIFKGHWIPDLKGSPYTNSSCATIPNSKNCFRHGRKDNDFLYWRWKPEGCHLPRFHAQTFLRMVRGKKLAFIGDSVARNHMESLLCLLSQEETPKDVYKDSEDRFRTWYFPRHDFTLMILWTKFLVVGEEQVVNGSLSGVYDLHLDKIDAKWQQKLPVLDYAIISDAHWFFRKMYLHQGGRLIGCVFCQEPNVTDLGLGFAIKMAFRSALERINGCGECKGMVTLLRTFSPAHFENGSWDTGGACERTSPLGEGEVNLGSQEWELRTIQVKEVERARRKGRKKGKRFGAVDVTRAMLMRPDGHPGAHWGNKWMKGYNDCVHWCMPGPIDAWNDFLMAVLGKEAGWFGD
ncbi:xyloglucan O-acetyltransferase 4 isoform X2 [Malania oleifera]|uniref:xyloglucan O-acetyltransferase 4 isoform X2 n=1 Tax=Malania oleifera TaxID=397392 RepID=UPI0025AE44BA|nr:xyloglucan O-acetyltransferase 4 isoform X2 [Malania oleifera]XP_057983260.1 xyloglucan O-acetyltransferase 4 isoform X2 [Malania oleifera]